MWIVPYGDTYYLSFQGIFDELRWQEVIFLQIMYGWVGILKKIKSLLNEYHFFIL